MIALFENTTKSNSHIVAENVVQFFLERGIQSIYESEIPTVDPKEISFLISLGGDGTILQAIHKYPELSAPLLGINLGHLGFMADVPVTDLYPSLQDLLQGSYRVHERLMITGKSPSERSCFAVNDIVIHRGQNPGLIELAIYVDGIYVNTFEADGMIIATPNGSTAYSLAAGGPILSPDLDAIVLTPISPHTISNRPIVLSPSQEIQIQYLSHHLPIEVRADGIDHVSLSPGELFKIAKSDKKFRLVSLPRRDYFSTLRSKLGWSGKLR